MTGFAAVLRSELAQFFATPLAYLLLGTFWAATGYFFSFQVFFVNAAHMVTTFHNMSVLLLLMVPLLTMRSFAEENRSGTLELLLTLPLGEPAIVAAKFVAYEVILLLMIGGTAVAVVPLVWFGSPDLGPVLGGYIGVVLLGTSFVALGLLTSSASRSQTAAAISCWGAMLALWFCDYGAAIGIDAEIGGVLRYLSFSVHYRDLIRGVLPVTTIVYFASLAALCLVVTAEGLRARRG